MKKLANVFDLLADSELHERLSEAGVEYRVVGGIGLQAVILSEGIDVGSRSIKLNPGASISSVRENGTRRDVDILITPTESKQIKVAKKITEDCLPDLSISVFGIKSVEQSGRGTWDFISRRIVSEQPNRLFMSCDTSVGELPWSILDAWSVKDQSDQTIYHTIGPASHYVAYTNRSITGVRPKDEDKIGLLKEWLEDVFRLKLDRVIAGDEVDAELVDMQDQIRAGHDFYSQLERRRRTISWFGAKAWLLSALESNERLVGLAQGSLEGILSGTVGRVR